MAVNGDNQGGYPYFLGIAALFCFSYDCYNVTVTKSFNVTGRNMTFVSAKEAEKLTGKSRQTLWRAAKKGKISAKKDDNGGNKFDLAELERVYGPLQQQETFQQVSLHPHATSKNNSMLQQEIDFLHEKIAMLENQIESSKDRERDLSSKLDKAQSTIEKQTYLISDMRPRAPQKPVEQRKRFLGIF